MDAGWLANHALVIVAFCRCGCRLPGRPRARRCSGVGRRVSENLGVLRSSAHSWEHRSSLHPRRGGPERGIQIPLSPTCVTTPAANPSRLRLHLVPSGHDCVRGHASHDSASSFPKPRVPHLRLRARVRRRRPARTRHTSPLPAPVHCTPPRSASALRGTQPSPCGRGATQSSGRGGCSPARGLGRGG